jgi:uncharacterized protein YkwD
MRKLICVVLAAVFLWLVVGVAAAEPAVAFDRQANERTLLRLINHARTKRGLSKLHLSKQLDRAALSHSRSMLSHGYFSHLSSGGGSFSGRLIRAGYSRKGCRSWAVSEVIAWGAGALGTPRAVFISWMHSSVHRSILLGKRWRDAGVGAASGTFHGLSGAVLFTVDLGRRTR